MFTIKLISKLRNNLHIIFLFLLCLIPVLWFVGRGDVLITGLDTNFPLNPLAWFVRRFFVWNGVNNAGVDFSSSTAGLFFHFIQVVPYLLGFSLKYVEIFSLVFWFSAIVASSFILAQIIVPKNRISQIIFVTIYSLNTYLFNTWENVKVSNLSLVASLPLFIAIVYLWVRKNVSSKKALVYLCFASILASGTGINPAYFAVIILVILIEVTILFLEGFKDRPDFGIIKIGGFSILILLAVNAFWIFPLSKLLLGSQTRALSDLGFTDWLQSLSQNASIINVARLQGAWDWYALDSYGMPQYLPYTLNYLYKLPFIVFSFALPFLSFLSFLFLRKEKRFWYCFLGTLTLLGIFFGVGSHSPTGEIYLFLSKHVPFFSFFRSPWYIFTPILVVAYAGLTGLLFERLYEIKFAKIRPIITGFGFLFLIGYSLYNYPLITGKIFRPDSNGFYITFPNYVSETRDWLIKEVSNQRIISYPDDQLESFDWGYKGTESILSLFSDRETITPSFNAASKTFSKIQSLFYERVKRKEYSSAISLLNFIGVNEIFYKKDVSTLSPVIEKDISNFVDIKDIGKWSFMKAKAQLDPKVFIANTIYKNLGNPEDFVYLSSLLGPKTVIVNAEDTEVAKISSFKDFPVILKADNLGEQKEEVSNIQKYRVTIPKDGVFRFAIEKDYVDKNEIKTQIDSRDIDSHLMNQNDSLIIVGPLNLAKGAHELKVVYPPASNILGPSDLSLYSKDMGLRKDELPEDVERTLVAYNSTNLQKVIDLPTINFNPYLKYSIGFDYKYIYGSVPIMDVMQSAPTSPVKTDPIYPGSSLDWDSSYKIYEPVETLSKLELFIKMPPNSPGDKSKAYFENISVKRIYDNKVFVIEEVNKKNNREVGTLTYKKINPVKYELELKGANGNQNGVVISFLESYSPGWVLRFESDNNSVVPPIHFTIDGYANAWYVPNVGEAKLTIYYKPQNIFLVGVVVSLLTMIGILINGFVKKKLR